MTRLKLDENLSVHLKPLLQQAGFDVANAADEELLSKPDTLLAEAARVEDRVLLTLDVVCRSAQAPSGSASGYPPVQTQIFRSRVS
jgi:predicted nuclease of predicted toxin-antitoxin system